jgi:POT family proton-dependent oligopeptide transporter
LNDTERRDLTDTDVAVEPMKAPGGTFLGYPKGVLLLSFTEMWERFSYFGMLAILVLYLSADRVAGGFGWKEEDALRLYGLYSGLAFCVPLIGGWIANNWWGERRCILVGGILIASGHACMAGPKLWPALGAPSFFGGLGLIILGTMLLKPTISSIVGQFFSPKDRRRDNAFALFLVGIYVGEISGVFITGYLGERVDWHLGFGAAGIGMTLGLLVYLGNQKRLLADIGKAPVGGGGALAALRNLTREERDRVVVILTQTFFTMLYSAAVFQTGGLLTLFAKDYVERDRWGWEIPASWFMTTTSILFIVLTPPAARLWTYLAERGRNPRTSVKLAMGLIAIGLGYSILVYVMTLLGGVEGAKASPLWLLAMYLFMGISEVLVWAGQLSLTSRLAPKSLSALFVGGWYINIGLGSWLTGYLGALGYTWGIQHVFTLIAVGTVAAGALVWLATPKLTRMMHGLE